MAQMGSFVPCSEAVVAIRDAVLTRVGAGDAVIRGKIGCVTDFCILSIILLSSTYSYHSIAYDSFWDNSFAGTRILHLISRGLGYAGSPGRRFNYIIEFRVRIFT